MVAVSTPDNLKTIDEGSRVQTKLTNINIDCLEEILKYLKLKDLLNIADSSERLRKAASFIFFSTHQPTIRIEYYERRGMHNQNWGVRYYSNTDRTTYSRLWGNPDKGQELDTLKSCFQFLRCFGNRITSLKIENDRIHFSFDLVDKSYIIIYERLLSHVNEHCSVSLKELNTFRCPCGTLNQLKKPFVNVETVRTSVGTLKTNLWNILFPNLRYLRYGDQSGIDESNEGRITKRFPFFGIDNKFPHLENLEVLESLLEFACEETIRSQLCTAIRLNPQLRALKLLFTPDLDIIHLARDNLPELEELDIHTNKKGTHILHDKQIHFKSVKIFKLTNYGELGSKFSSNFDFPFTFDHLEQFGSAYNIFESTEAISKFFKQNPSIVKLLLNRKDFLMVHPSEFAKMLPSLVELEVVFDIPVESVINFIIKNETIRTVFFSTRDDRKNLDYLQHLGWKYITSMEKYIYAYRKPHESPVSG